jgi:hypothetical protein
MDCKDQSKTKIVIGIWFNMYNLAYPMCKRQQTVPIFVNVLPVYIYMDEPFMLKWLGCLFVCVGSNISFPIDSYSINLIGDKRLIGSKHYLYVFLQRHLSKLLLRLTLTSLGGDFDSFVIVLRLHKNK